MPPLPSAAEGPSLFLPFGSFLWYLGPLIALGIALVGAIVLVAWWRVRREGRPS